VYCTIEEVGEEDAGESVDEEAGARVRNGTAVCARSAIIIAR
jgi:hypothetical protein